MAVDTVALAPGQEAFVFKQARRCGCKASTKAMSHIASTFDESSCVYC
jgi:hypothetical protein